MTVSPAIADALGYAAAALVLTTFCMRTMMPLRLIAIASNVAFAAYGAAAGLFPILVLHLILLPLNIWRLIELRRLVRQAGAVVNGELSLGWLIPYARREAVRAGRVLFRQGDAADRLYVVLHGAVLIEGVGVTLRDGAVFGEMAMFSRSGLRSQTARCIEPCDLLSISRAELALLCQHHPDLAFYLIRLITDRLLANEARLTARLAAADDAMPAGRDTDRVAAFGGSTPANPPAAP